MPKVRQPRPDSVGQIFVSRGSHDLARARDADRSASFRQLPGLGNNGETASNFSMFLQLLTTQLKNQNPLSPTETNQLT